jgi:hypothetical protein
LISIPEGNLNERINGAGKANDGILRDYFPPLTERRNQPKFTQIRQMLSSTFPQLKLWLRIHNESYLAGYVPVKL